jgi:hypothetical protein
MLLFSAFLNAQVFNDSEGYVLTAIAHSPLQFPVKTPG